MIAADDVIAYIALTGAACFACGLLAALPGLRRAWRERDEARAAHDHARTEAWRWRVIAHARRSGLRASDAGGNRAS